MKIDKNVEDFTKNLPVLTLKSVEKNYDNPISLQALGLLVNLHSFSKNWRIRKTEVLRRFAKNKETSVKRAWDELVDTGYIIEGKYRVGPKYEYIYMVNIKPFTDTEKRKIINELILKHDGFTILQNQKNKTNTSKSTPNIIKTNTNKINNNILNNH